MKSERTDAKGNKYFTDESGREYRLLAMTTKITADEGHVLMLALELYMKTEKAAAIIWEKHKMPDEVRKVLDKDKMLVEELVTRFKNAGQYK